MRLMTFFVVLVAALQGWSSLAAAPKANRVAIVGFTDLHGALESEAHITATGQKVHAGGAQYISSYLNILRHKYKGTVVVIDAGDLFQGTLVSNTYEGKPVVSFYHHVSLAAAALGNHDFDYGPVGENSIPMTASDDPRGAIKARIAEAQFPFLSVNTVEESTGKIPSWLKASRVVVRNGVRIGIIGATTPNTVNTTVRANLVGLKFIDVAPAVTADGRRLREKEAVDVVVLAYHGGGGCRDNKRANQDDLSSCEQNSELFELVRAIPAGLVDVVFGGDSHKGVAKRIGGTVVMQTYAKGSQIGWADVSLEGGRPQAQVAGFMPVCGTVVKNEAGFDSCSLNDAKKSSGPVFPATFLGETVTPDLWLQRILKPYLDHVAAIQNAPLGVKTLAPILRSPSPESPLGNMMTDIMLEAVPGADVAITNNGGIRTDLPAGPLVYNHIFEVFPFDNRLAVLKVTGEQLQKAIEAGLVASTMGYVWAGVAFETKDCNVVRVTVGGRSLDPAKVYTLVTSDYLASGGGGFDRLGLSASQVTVLWEKKFILRELVVDTLKKWGRDLQSSDFYNPAAPRITIRGTCKPERS